MKTRILFIVFSLMVSFAFGQTAMINGANNSAFAVCAGSTPTLTASITGGFVSGDTLTWVQQINGGGGILISRNVYTVNQTITVPRDPSSPAVILPAATGNTYAYTLIIKRGGSNFVAAITMTVNALPTIGNVTFSSPCSDEDMIVTIDGLSAPFPLSIKIYDDGILPGNLVFTQSVSSASISFPIHYWIANGDASNLYIEVVRPSTGCKVWK